MKRRSAVVVVLLWFALCSAAAEARCERRSAVSVLAAKSFGDVYNQLASDGDELPASYFVKAQVVRAEYAFSVQAHRSAYDTQHEGAATNTVVRTISGQTIAVPWFVAHDQTAEIRVARCMGLTGLYAGIGFVQTSANYSFPLGYSNLSGAGIGVERLSNPNHRLDFFSALYWYPAASGAYGNTRLYYTIVTFDGGVRWRLGASNTGLIAGLYQEMRALHPAARTGLTIRAAPYIGFEAKL